MLLGLIKVELKSYEGREGYRRVTPRKTIKTKLKQVLHRHLYKKVKKKLLNHLHSGSRMNKWLVGR